MKKFNNFNDNAIEYKNYLKGKNVIICGPGDILTGKNLGKYINSYDVIVRLNNSYPVNIFNYRINQDVGNRTDVLYHTGAICTCLKQAANKYSMGRIALLKNDKLTYFVSKRDPYHGNTSDKKFLNRFIKIHNAYMKLNKNENPIKLVPVYENWLNELKCILNNTDPNMSTMAITHLLQFDIKKLEIVGCDFYGTGYHKYYTLPNHIKWSDQTSNLVRKDGKKRRKPKVPHNYSYQIDFLLDVFENDKRVKIDKNILKTWKKHIS